MSDTRAPRSGTTLSFEGKRCELCNREWFYIVASREDLPDFCKGCKATYLKLKREGRA